MNKEKEDEENITNKNEINHNSEIINNMPININEYDYQNENDNFNNRIRELNYYPNNNIDYFNYNNNIMPIEQNQEINNEDNYNYSGFQNELELEQNYE